MSRRLFLITEFYDSSQNTTGYLFSKLYSFLNSQDDIDLTLIAKRDAQITNQPKALYVRGIEFDKKSIVSRASYELFMGLSFLKNCAQHIKKDDIVFTGTTPILLLIIIHLLKKVIGFKWVLLVHDVFPENLVAAKIIKQHNFGYKLLKRVFDNVYASADDIIVIGRDMKNLVYDKTNHNKITVIPSWIDEEDITLQSKSDNSILTDLGWQGDQKVVFQFFGNLGRVQGISNLMKAIKLMKRAEDAQFIFIGDGVYVDELKSLIGESNNQNLIYYGSVSQENKSIGLNACDISIVTLADGMLGLGVPSKAYYSMAADKLIFTIMDKNSETYQMVEENNIGWVVESSNIEEIAKMLDKAVSDIRTQKYNSPRKTLIDKFSSEVAMNNILDIIRTL
ncbi:glycosyltransferase family 4 protein [Psychrobacter sp. ANT_H56B]|uniref:glycosyltransferase family 4 protein n=1 Tax=Psychrobacter sp. ANT_H56B TaxID=2597353 RepID=UPI0011F38A12|nr:glycosyltransferase family 4 protein [Psychrobacter sp. ANT_H56B]KAA0924171.1 glycosyltransferase family 4 protein [Psychrobacter sp. ANT_H56B]